MAKSKAHPAPSQPPPTQDAEPETPVPEPRTPVDVRYCTVCSVPVEYCEFGTSLTRCMEKLREENSVLYDKYYSEGALQARLGTLSLEAQSRLEKDTAKKEAKAEAKADAALKKKLASTVTIKRIERTKRKHVTSVFGLEAFGIDLKKAAKQFASKFATGASVTKNPQGLEEIVVQGDVSNEVLEMLEQQVGVLKGVPSANVELVEDKKKKAE